MNNITYSHEHLSIDLSTIKKDEDCKLNLYEDALDELKELKEKGVSRIVDCSNYGMGVDWDINRKISQELDIEIINATGFYKDPFLPNFVMESSIEELAEIMLSDLRKGAKVIGEIGTSLNKMTIGEKKVFEAACLAQSKSNAVIITHTTLGTMAKEQVYFLKERGVNLKKVILSHVALAKDFKVIEELVKEGVNIAFDTIGKEEYCSDEMQAKYILKLIEKGYIHQILLSMDCTRKSHLKKNGGKGYSYLLDSFVPLLKENGISEDSLEEILCHNFTRILEGNI